MIANSASVPQGAKANRALRVLLWTVIACAGLDIAAEQSVPGPERALAQTIPSVEPSGSGQLVRESSILTAQLGGRLSPAAGLAEPSLPRFAASPRAADELPLWRSVAAPPFGDGRRVTATWFDTSGTDHETNGSPTLEFDPPRWFHRETLLGAFRGGSTPRISVRWDREVQGLRRARMVLVHHPGYARVDDTEEAPWRARDDRVTEHRFPAFRGRPPGLYDAVIVACDGSGDYAALGQVFYGGWCEARKEVGVRVAALYPGARQVFAGGAVLAPGFRLRLAVPAGEDKTTRVAVISCAEWLEGLQDGLLVASVGCGGGATSGSLRLGRDTASGWYDWHARRRVRHTRAPIAWSDPAEKDGEAFDAHMYRAEVPLGAAGPNGAREIEITYRRRAGLLRIAAVVLLP